MTDAFIAKYGRKFSLAVLAMGLGFVVTLTGLLLVVRVPNAAVYVSEIIGQFALVLSVSIGAFSGANAAVEWRHGNAGSSSSITTVTQRQSGTVTEPPVTLDGATH